MKRSVRNGIAIAGMAGGMWLLGQAVASADQVADASNGVDQTNTSVDSDGGGANLNFSEAEATNEQEVEVETDVEGGDGGVNIASINTGVVNEAPRQVEVLTTVEEPNGDGGGIEVNFESGDVTLTQEANGGDVNKSGNVAVGDLGDQTAIASNEVSQSNSSEGDDHDWNGGPRENGPQSLSPGNSNHDDGNANLNFSEAEASNEQEIEVETDIEGGDGGVNIAEINTGIIGNTFYCPEHATCTFNFTTGSVTVYQSANGGDVNGSGNVGIGAPVPGVGHHHDDCDCPKPVVRHDDCPKHQPEVKPAARPEARHLASAPVLSSAQPVKALAFTGSTGDEISLPLTLGLLALGMGGALTLAGRRRETTNA
jgi:hypothetical protein